MLMVLKRNGSLKARGVASGSAQRLYASKDGAPPPAPGFYASKRICAAIAKEGRGAAAAGLPGLFLQAGQDEWLLLKLAGPAALMLAECDEKWRKHLRKEHGRWATYIVCKKATYGTMNAALLACKKLAKLLAEWELAMSPYGPCARSKMAGNNQLAVMLHTGGLLVSCVCAAAVTHLIESLKEEYGSKDPLAAARGKVRECLGMATGFRVPGRCAMSQHGCIKKNRNELPGYWKTGYRNTPAPENLFKIDQKPEELGEEIGRAHV